MSTDSPLFDFDESVLTAVMDHMNSDHRHDSLSIVRVLGATPDAVAATVAEITAEGVAFDADTAEGMRRVTVAWAEVPVTRADIRHELVRMTNESSESPS